MGSLAWKAMSIVAGLAASKAAKAATGGTWKAAVGNPPPKSKHDPAVSNRNAAMYAVLSAAVMAGAKVFAERKAADYYTKSAGHPPKAVQKQADKDAEKRQKELQKS